MNHHRCYISIPMDVSAILNVTTMQHHRCYINVPMNVSPILNVLTTQLGTSCSFDSPGLARNEPTPGQRSQGDSTPSVLSFFRENMVSMRGLIGCYVNIPMNTSPILNVITTQYHRSYINVPMNVFATMNTLTTQLGTSCSFDSPGLARNEPTPGKHSQGDSTP